MKGDENDNYSEDKKIKHLLCVDTKQFTLFNHYNTPVKKLKMEAFIMTKYFDPYHIASQNPRAIH